MREAQTPLRTRLVGGAVFVVLGSYLVLAGLAARPIGYVLTKGSKLVSKAFRDQRVQRQGVSEENAGGVTWTR